MSSLRKGIIQNLKSASGYHYKRLSVTNYGTVEKVKLVQGYETGEDWERSHYLLTCVDHFTIKTDVSTTMLRGQRMGDGISNYVLLQISTANGEVFYILVHTRRLPEIRSKALHYRSL